ncbi:MAG: tetratricopeptide repeat protein, partial [Actinomycetes bacterium]
LNPVVIDLWAAWCQPCKSLSPILEQVAESYNGAILLAKVDVDANPTISQAFRVQSIPAVFAVINGQVLPLFTGAVPQTQVKQAFEIVLQQARQLGVPCADFNGVAADVTAEVTAGDVGNGSLEAQDDGDPRFEAAMNAIDAADWDAAKSAYESVLATDATDRDAKMGVVLVGLLSRLGDADPDALVATAMSSPTDLQSQFDAADALAINGRYDEAFAVMLAAVRANVADERNRARAHMVELFDLAGDEEPSVQPARVALANALF